MDENLKRQATETGCPEPEELSAYVDGEAESSAGISTHIQVCKRCGAIVDDYAKLASDIKCALSASEDDALSARIKAGVQEKLKRETSSKAPINFPYWISSIAAGLAVCALGAYMVTHMEQIPSAQKVELTSDTHVPPAIVSSLKHAELTSPPDSSFGSIDLKNLSSVSFGGDDGSKLIAENIDEAQAQKPVFIDPSVKHVWTAPAGTDVQAKMESIASELGLEPKAIAISSTENGEVKAKTTLSRRQAVALVRTLKVSGFDLLSPQQPQPEQRLFRGAGDEPVDYEASFVTKR